MTAPPATLAPPPAAVRSCLQWARAPLAALDDAALTAQALLAHVLGVSRSQLLAHPEWPVAPEPAAAFAALVARAARGEPLAYLTGWREFCGLAFAVTPAVLVPRPETERLVELALAAPPARPPAIADVGTGSGCIAVTLACRWPAARVTALDISPAALAVAQRNARHHGVNQRVTGVRSDLLAALLPGTARFSLICANLPYLDSAALPGLAVARHEPRLALDGGPGGLDLIARLLPQAARLLAPGGRALLEFGQGQGAAVQTLARAAFPRARLSRHADFAGLERVLLIETDPGEF